MAKFYIFHLVFKVSVIIAAVILIHSMVRLTAKHTEAGRLGLIGSVLLLSAEGVFPLLWSVMGSLLSRTHNISFYSSFAIIYQIGHCFVLTAAIGLIAAAMYRLCSASLNNT